MLQSLTQYVALGEGCNPPQFFGLRPWYQYLNTDANCNIIDFKVLGGSAGSDFVLIALAVLDDILRIAALAAIGYIIYGGILYVTSQGSPDQTGKAQNTIVFALVGVIVTILAVAVVNFLGGRLGVS